MPDDIMLDEPETRIEKLLAAAAGENIQLDEPQTRIERYLYKIAQGSGGVPAVEDADKGKYLHANESTGDLEWATAGGSGGGGFLVVHLDGDGVLDKTWREIDAADVAVIVFSGSEDGETWHNREFVVNTPEINGDYFVNAIGDGGVSTYVVSSPDDYPTVQ